MKIKSLLVAGLAVLAMNAYAETFTCTSTVTFPEGYTIEAGQTDAAYQMLTLNRVDDTDNFTNLQMNVYLPEGLSFAQLASSSEIRFFNEDEDAETPAANLVYNDQGDFFTIALTNATYHGDQVKITKNPVGICRFKMAAAEGFNGGDVKAYLKYTDYANNDYVNEEFVMVTIPGAGEVAVENINAGKAVAGVKYYNVAGQAADSAFEGVNIVVTTYADGTQNVVKVVK